MAIKQMLVLMPRCRRHVAIVPQLPWYYRITLHCMSLGIVYSTWHDNNPSTTAAAVSPPCRVVSYRLAKRGYSYYSTHLLPLDYPLCNLSGKNKQKNKQANKQTIPPSATRRLSGCRTVLCCAVLCCAVLCCAVLCCAVLCCAVLCCAVLDWAGLLG